MRTFAIALLLLTTTAAQANEPGVIESFVLDRTPLREAFAVWSNLTDVPVIANWQALEDAGIEVDRPVSISLQHVRAGTALHLLMQWAASDTFTTLVYEVQPSYIEILTRQQALRRPIVRVYDVRDLLIEIPYFDDAPRLSLTDSLSNISSGSNGSNDLFDDNDRERPQRMTRTERGEQLATLIRETIEPDIWQAHGGEHASITYYDGRLIVKAPQFVHGEFRRSF